MALKLIASKKLRIGIYMIFLTNAYGLLLKFISSVISELLPTVLLEICLPKVSIILLSTGFSTFKFYFEFVSGSESAII
jgi:hypothetical protein